MATPNGIEGAGTNATVTTTVDTAPVATADPFPALLEDIRDRNTHEPTPAAHDEASSASLTFSIEEIAALRHNYKLLPSMLFATTVPGIIGFRPNSPGKNREFFEQLEGDETGFKKCEDILIGETGKEKCEWLREAAEKHAETTWVDTSLEIGKYVLYTLGGFAGTWSIFGPGMSFWHFLNGKYFGGPTGANAHMFAIVFGSWLYSVEQEQSRREKQMNSLN